MDIYVYKMTPKVENTHYFQVHFQNRTFENDHTLGHKIKTQQL